ncbi:MAG: hypothetical protein KDD00_09050 [Ignavibacteriae bacterium]|nr:hypothetical protein [Ignavibacteriota bacterium]
MTKLELVKEKLEKVSPKDLDTVDEFIEKIISSKKKTGDRKMKLNLRGVLSDLKPHYTSVELQHKANELRVEDAINNKKK